MMSEAIVFMIVSQPTRASPDWWNTSWQYRRPITLGSRPENYQVKVIIPSDIPKSDYPSIRFLSGENGYLLPYWIEHNENLYNTSGQDIAWVRVLDNSNDSYSSYLGGNTIYMYYHNPSVVSAENGDNVFIFFDDFGGGTGGQSALNTNKWSANSVGLDVYENVLRLGSGFEGYITHDESKGLSTDEENTPRIIETRVKNTSTDRGGLMVYGSGQTNNDETACMFQKGGGEYRFFSKNFPGTDGGYLSQQNHEGDKWYIFTVSLYGANKDNWRTDFYQGNDNSTYRTLIEESQVLTGVDWAPPAPKVDTYRLRVWAGTYYFDWIFVRKWAATEPSVIVENVQTLPGKPLLSSPPDGTTTFDNMPTFQWTNGENANSIQLLVDNDPDFSSPEVQFVTGPSGDNFTGISLAPENYSWKVIASNDFGWVESSVWTFVINEVQPLWTGTVTITLDNLYSVTINLNGDFSAGENLVAKFYTYSGGSQDNTLVDNENIPGHVTLNKHVSRPGKNALQRIDLVVTDSGGTALGTIKTWTTSHPVLIGRVGTINGQWPFLSEAQKPTYVSELGSINGTWPFSPET
jgi:hypothetical protein